MSLLSEPGIYPPELVPAELYHGGEICPGPSISSTGLKTILRSPRHYWHSSPLNPDRPRQKDRPHFALGRAVHDRLLLGERWPEFYHILPDGFSRTKTKQMADEIAAADEAEAAGLTLLSEKDAGMVEAMFAAVMADKLLARAIERGEAEQTAVAQHPVNGVWQRVRPDLLTPNRTIMIDIKTAEDASPAAMARAVRSNGYLLSAAYYLDVWAQVTGERPQEYWLLAIEKQPPHVVATYVLDPEDIARAQYHFVRPALDTFARCIAANDWPAYPHQTLGMSGWERKTLDEKELAE